MTIKKALTALAALVALIPGLLAGTAASASTTGVQPGDPDYHSTVCYKTSPGSQPMVGAWLAVSEYPRAHSSFDVDSYVTGADGCAHIAKMNNHLTGGSVNTTYYVQQGAVPIPGGISGRSGISVAVGETRWVHVAPRETPFSYSKVSGRVTYEGRPVAGATIVSSPGTQEFFTDSDGYFEAWASPGEVLTTLSSNPKDVIARGSVTVEAGVSSVEITMAPWGYGKKTRLTLRDSSGNPVQGAMVQIPFSTWNDIRAKHSLGETAADGSIDSIWDNTAIGQNGLVRLPSGCATTSGSNVTRIIATYSATTGEAVVSMANVTCNQAVYTGGVFGPDGPVSGATIEVLAVDGTAVATTTSGADGTYKVSARRLDAPGTQTLRVSAEGMVTQERAVPADTDQTGVDFHLLPPDTVAPVVDAEPGHMNLLAGLEWDSLLGVSALDETDGAVLPALVGETPTTVGDHALTYEARDGAGNVGTAGRTVTVAEPSLSIAKITAPHTATSGDEVAWSFVVLNDSIFPVVLDNAKCDTSTLAPGESTSCTGSGTADTGR